jgi:hypothetical protein
MGNAFLRRRTGEQVLSTEPVERCMFREGDFMICGALVRVNLLTLALLAALPMAAFAQSAITGVVKDTSGAILPGVTGKHPAQR